jgi:Fe-S cluster biogenesis protein NfuA
MMAQDGGAIELMQIKDGRVFVQLKGACNGCAASGSTLKFIVEKNLKEFIHPDISVVNVLPGMEEEILNG